ncbi:MAG: glutamate 5-kinase, partial [Chloroflexota bacterium]|nr:glutamate 5-kinase [Chloroflexota bacterium]
PRVECIDEGVERMAGGSGERGTGGMTTKVQAARLATASGVAVVIAHGQASDVLVRLAQGEALGTFFVPCASKLESRQRWMLSGLSSRGRIAVDEGAAKALREQSRSLLPAGIREVEGDFQRGDIVTILDEQGKRVACGIVNYSARDLEAIKGCRSDGILACLGYEYGAEAVHRNNLVLL